VQLRIVDGLLEALTHEHVWVRRNAADALGTSVPLMTHLGGQPIIQAVIDGLATLACTDTAAHEVEAETPRLSGEQTSARLSVFRAVS
jgi:HEAT repeat protein